MTNLISGLQGQMKCILLFCPRCACVWSAGIRQERRHRPSGWRSPQSHWNTNHTVSMTHFWYSCLDYFCSHADTHMMSTYWRCVCDLHYNLFLEERTVNSEGLILASFPTDMNSILLWKLPQTMFRITPSLHTTVTLQLLLLIIIIWYSYFLLAINSKCLDTLPVKGLE